MNKQPIPQIEVLYDYASPWSYIACERLIKELADCEITYTPIYLRGLESFSKGIPYQGAKLLYLIRDLERVAKRFDIAMKQPESFPVNGLYALRAALAAKQLGCFEQFHMRMFRSVWSESKEVSSAQSVLDLITSYGLDASAFAPLMNSDVLKEQLKKNTAEAVEKQVFGVPMIVVENELFWGQDRLEYVREAAFRSQRTLNKCTAA
jgi:2-hydroxychromene-2-carboxylate isomerase